MTLDERIRENLGVAARNVGPAHPKSVDLVRHTAQRRSVIRWTGLGSLAVAIVGGLVFLAGSSSIQQDIAIGDLDPEGLEVVQGLPGPEPQFDTSGLGEDVTLQPVDDTEGIPDTFPPYVEGEIFFVAILGETSSGTEAFVTFSMDSEAGRELVYRCWIAVHSVTGGGSDCVGDSVDNIGFQPGELIPPEALGGPSLALGGPGQLLYPVSRDTSVVVLTVNGESEWQRPIGQVAVFETNLKDGDALKLTSFDATGDVINEWSASPGPN